MTPHDVTNVIAFDGLSIMGGYLHILRCPYTLLFLIGLVGFILLEALFSSLVNTTDEHHVYLLVPDDTSKEDTI